MKRTKMIVEVNGIKYQSVDEPKRKPLPKMAQMALMLGGVYGVGLSYPTTDRSANNISVDFVKEYGLIENKQSKLSRNQRDYVVWYFEKHFNKIE